ncbi:lysozyme [Paraglaciecola chathamensis]|uniref:Lysozyme n=1 Tax=Paraglaciecola agarilytica NO2 TaxID=1125747 RepID=A0ABQ0IE39_9ALTE|nr:lysozyme [Paraglaciecola agarilytica]GAC07624.1 lysozyme [Paraglaciecola agarilytica NO2]
MKIHSLYQLIFSATVLLSGCATQKTSSDLPHNTPQLTSSAQRTTNQACIDIIKESEGVRLKAYRGPAGHWLIGYGHKAGVKQGMEINAPQAEVFLKNDLLKIEEQMSKLVKVPVNNNQFSALVCLGYNIGMGNLYKSTLLRLLNKGDYTGASDQFSVWRKAAGKVNAHLVKRRAKEKSLFDK